MTATAKSTSLLHRVSSWLASEGYPTEFRTANIFQKHGFHVTQGAYVRGDAEGLKREIDVLASITARASSGFLRISYVVECKWSTDKPWIVFTSSSTEMAPSACIAQTISSKLGEAIVWAVAGNETLQSLQTFLTPENGVLAVGKPSVKATMPSIRRCRHLSATLSLTSPNTIADAAQREPCLKQA